MNRTTDSTRSYARRTRGAAPNSPLESLVTRIAYELDVGAWRCFQARTPFLTRDGRRMCLAEYAALRSEGPWAQRLVGHRTWLLELAYDLVMDRFGPPTGDFPLRPKRRRRRQRDIGSLSYWRALCRLIDRSLADGVLRDELERETMVAAIVQGFTDRHIRFACLEASRKKNPGRSRYRLRTPGGDLNVWAPARLSARTRGPSLQAILRENNAPEGLDARSVQSLIDQRFGLCAQTELLELPASALASRDHEEPPQSLAKSELADRDLPMIVAHEKAAAVELQRPAIRALGAENLRLLVLAIFEELSAESFCERRLAQRFGISPATFSRFAGSRWKRAPQPQVPDLYANLAHVVATDGVFVECAQEAGVWDAVHQVQTSVTSPRLRRPAHD